MMQTIFGEIKKVFCSVSHSNNLPFALPFALFLLLQYIFLLFIIISTKLKLTMTEQFASNDKIYIKSHTHISNACRLFYTFNAVATL